MLSSLTSVAWAHLTSHKIFLLFPGGSTEELRKMLDVNVLALSVCTIQAFQSMKERGVDDGHIIHINRLQHL
jgi:short-subunit dehydrogenase